MRSATRRTLPRHSGPCYSVARVDGPRAAAMRVGMGARTVTALFVADYWANACEREGGEVRFYPVKAAPEVKLFQGETLTDRSNARAAMAMRNAADLAAAPAPESTMPPVTVAVEVETESGRFRVTLANGKATQVAKVYPGYVLPPYPVNYCDPFGPYVAAARKAESAQ